MKSVVLLIAFAALASAAEEFSRVSYKPCKGSFKVSAVELSNVEVKEVDKKKIAFIKQGTKPSIRITFVAGEDVEKLTTFVSAKIGDALLPYNVDEENACEAGGLSCPLTKDKEYKFTQGVHISPTYPKGDNIMINWKLGADEEHIKVCVVFIGHILLDE